MQFIIFFIIFDVNKIHFALFGDFTKWISGVLGVYLIIGSLPFLRSFSFFNDVYFFNAHCGVCLNISNPVSVHVEGCAKGISPIN